MPEKSILVVEDEPSIAEVVSLYLRRAGYQVQTLANGQSALDTLEKRIPDLVVLDLMLPGVDGYTLTRWLRDRSEVPIIMLTSRREEMDRIAGLEMGADDYVVKPFSPRQLVARVEALLRRSGSGTPAPDSLTVGDMRLDPARGEVYICGELRSHLTRLENELLQTLLLHRDQVLSADVLIDHVWGPGGGDRAMLKQLVYRLRRKTKNATADCPDIETIPGVGYSLVTSRKARVPLAD